MYINRIFFEYLKTVIKILPIKSICLYNNELAFFIKLKHIKFVMLFFKNNTFSQYKSLSSISGIDYIFNKYRFEINYDLLSIRYNNRIKIKVCLTELQGIPSCEKLFPAASWYECEIWDLFGIFFQQHSNLKRILTDYGFIGNPLRKDFPLSGFVEIRYCENEKKIVTNHLEFSQEYRTFNYKSPWDSFI